MLNKRETRKEYLERVRYTTPVCAEQRGNAVLVGVCRDRGKVMSHIICGSWECLRWFRPSEAPFPTETIPDASPSFSKDKLGLGLNKASSSHAEPFAHEPLFCLPYSCQIVGGILYHGRTHSDHKSLCHMTIQ